MSRIRDAALENWLLAAFVHHAECTLCAQVQLVHFCDQTGRTAAHSMTSLLKKQEVPAPDAEVKFHDMKEESRELAINLAKSGYLQKEKVRALARFLVRFSTLLALKL